MDRSMNAPPGDPQMGERIADIAELGAKIIIALGAILGGLWAFTTKIAKPYHAWRRAARLKERHEMEMMLRSALSEELATIAALKRVPEQLEALFKDHDLLLEIAFDNRERHDETNALLDFLGFTSDRRSDDSRRAEVTDMVTTLAERRRDRRRKMGE
jgi:hypothetical protein